MSRTLTPAVEAALAADNVTLVAFAELDFASGYVRATTAGYDIVWNTYTWSGLGTLGAVEAIGESAEFFAHGVALRLSGIPSALVSTARTEHYQGRAARIWIAPLDASHQVIADPFLAWVGRMDVMTIEMGKSATITVSTETRFADWDRPRTRLYSDADQQAEYASDTGFRFLEQLAEKSLVWGGAGGAVTPQPQAATPLARMTALALRGPG